MNKVSLSPPWFGYANEIRELFSGDSDISVKYFEDENELAIYVEGTDKYDALVHLLPTEKDFGGVKLRITIHPANPTIKDTKHYLKSLFKGNKRVTLITDVGPVDGRPSTFIEFRKCIVQYWNDNLGDLNGNTTRLLEDIARNIFEDSGGVSFCTSEYEDI